MWAIMANSGQVRTSGRSAIEWAAVGGLDASTEIPEHPLRLVASLMSRSKQANPEDLCAHSHWSHRESKHKSKSSRKCPHVHTRRTA